MFFLCFLMDIYFIHYFCTKTLSYSLWICINSFRSGARIFFCMEGARTLRSLNFRHIVTPCSTKMSMLQKTRKTQAIVLKVWNWHPRCLAITFEFFPRVCARICSYRDTLISNPGFDTTNSQTIHYFWHFNSFKIYSSTLQR